MGWVDKTPVTVEFSICEKKNKAVSFLSATAIGLALVFCLPGQVETNYYANSTPDLTPEEIPSAAPVLRGMQEVEFVQDLTPSKTVEIEPLLPNISVQKPTAPVQFASLDLKLPEIQKPKIYSPPKSSVSIPELQTTSRTYGVKPRLEKKLFGSVELRFEDERRIRAWSGVYYKFTSEVETLKSCVSAPQSCSDPVLSAWAGELRQLKGMTNFDKIAAVNSLVNKRTYADDRRVYGRSDYWASPREFLTRAGDCEDFAILKFASLIALGMDDDNLRLVVGRLSDGTPHAFLAAKLGQNEFILDNRQTEVYLTTDRSDYVPKYSMNLSYRWSHVMPKTKST
jgi:predicted transglutaminase-like cysteine proteinase